MSEEEYQRPADYKFTSNIIQRLVGTLRFNTDIIEEIEERKELNGEAFGLLIISFGLIAALSINTIRNSTNFIILDDASMISRILMTTFGGGFAFIFLTAKIGQVLGGANTETNAGEIIRVIAYTYPVRILERLINLQTGFDPTHPLFTLWILSFVYFAMLVILVIGRALDQDHRVAWSVVIPTILLTMGLEFGLEMLNDIIFGPSFI